ncbi:MULTISPECIES: S9 family peptidase [unclassified Lysobacter]|uniref:alpha/beta hydrolase family protein n=1 Tax=unclassified Lysobacter TaxID=2635362 RepID=UPI0006F46126|nr:MULTISPECIES: S9 family peptidase [unclassified Lysobacter]KQZ60035.1 peptidase S9 [Lysobacter sp. Root559]KRC38479.1 peptidase S9 [Lysobacter sp. Root76]KRD71324.1 peptidase S9 [Lysobacter sp. Root96]
MKKLHLAVLGLALCAASAQAADAPSGAPSIADFVRHPTYSGAKISPSGEYLALTVDRGDQDVLTVLRTKDLSVVKVNQLPDEKSVGQFEWVSPERLIFNSVKKLGRYAQPFGTGEWYGVNADGTQPRPLVFYGTRDATQRGKQVGNERFQLLDTLRDDDVNVIMAVTSPRSSEGSGTELVLFDTLTGRRKSLARAPRENCEIALDAAKAPRFAICYDDEDAQGNFDSQNELYRRGDDGKWTLINSSKSSGKHLSVIGTSTDGLIYANQSDGKKPEALGTIDPATGVFNSLFEDAVSDPAGYITSADGDTILGVITEAGAPRVTMVDEKHPDAEIYASLAGAFPGQLVRFSSATKDGKKIVVSVVSDKNPGELYLYDRDTGKARFLMQGRKWLDPKKMASVKPFSMTTRDGLKIHGYLTIPNGSDGKNLPMIVNVHGGPMGPRDDWAFNWETQMLASRGYLVMQINYRGSGGFGKGFQDMGYGTWATGIMNDIIDATKWTINQGYADGDRVCIYGGSFGGYASLMAPTIDQTLFKCSFGYVGAYDIDVQLTKSDTSDRESGRRYMARAFGKTKAEQDAMSPVKHADKFKIPVYLAAGARDPRCPPENTESMNKALIAAGNPPEGMIIQSGEMHGFYKEENNQRLYTEMLNFFDRHIGGKVKVGGASKAN